ncbi:MAG: hypothetical protein HQL58_09530 [Magnetococcales bacterium]|nr:hypothetical protein [Magnetococcales bacterium]
MAVTATTAAPVLATAAAVISVASASVWAGEKVLGYMEKRREQSDENSTPNG